MWTRSDAVVQLEAHDDSVTGGHTHMTYIPRNNLIYVYLSTLEKKQRLSKDGVPQLELERSL